MPLNVSVVGTKVSLCGYETWQPFSSFSALSWALPKPAPVLSWAAAPTAGLGTASARPPPG